MKSWSISKSWCGRRLFFKWWLLLKPAYLFMILWTCTLYYKVNWLITILILYSDSVRMFWGMLWAMCLSFPVVKRWHDNEAQGGGRREREERGDKFRRGDEACMKWKSKTSKKGERWVGGILGGKSEKKTCSWESDKVCDSVVHWPVVLCHFITVTLPPSLSLWHYIDVSKFVWHHTGCFFLTGPPL